MATSPDFTILAAPRIPEAKFIAILRAGGSPATAEGPACYRAFVAAGVDPAVALGVFRKESTYGRAGRAPRNRSWGNIRGSSAGYPLDSGNFRIYPSWTAGAADAARLLAIYGRNQIRPGTNTSTVQTFPYVWAPSTDGNAPDAYGDSIARWVQEWSGQAGSSGVGSGSLTSIEITDEDPRKAPPPTPPTGSETIIVPVRRVFLETFKRPSTATLDQWYADGWVNYLVEQRGTGGDVTGLFPFLNPSAADYQAQLAVTTAALARAIGPHVGKTTYGALPTSLSVTVAAKFETNPLVIAAQALGQAIGAAATNAVLLAAILVVILLALYRLAKT